MMVLTTTVVLGTAGFGLLCVGLVVGYWARGRADRQEVREAHENVAMIQASSLREALAEAEPSDGEAIEPPPWVNDAYRGRKAREVRL